MTVASELNATTRVPSTLPIAANIPESSSGVISSREPSSSSAVRRSSGWRGSSSRGSVPTAADALKILEAPILRWLYVRRQPKQAFNVDFGAEVVRLYDEWDALARKAANRQGPSILSEITDADIDNLFND